MSTEMLLTHLVLGLYSLALTAGIYVHHQLKTQGHAMQHLALVLLLLIEAAGLVCIFYHLLKPLLR
ncbi:MULTISPECIES: hypothetical protein [Alishewanella]|uniref:Uncharacterized protein n=1 Tax=Alishewanella aestuarii B11 TaxID=1197174 RepID=J2IEN6_9ALTE|nr:MULTISPECIES: hypothetical protein [Alishewanella]EJI85169.1 hypothetical protein AEST_22710 [Alishewanella aestuarii B11]OCW95342.1 hypothetical protein A9165_14160 [Alishewanella sp. HH-ZS]